MVAERDDVKALEEAATKRVDELAASLAAAEAKAAVSAEHRAELQQQLIDAKATIHHQSQTISQQQQPSMRAEAPRK